MNLRSKYSSRKKFIILGSVLVVAVLLVVLALEVLRVQNQRNVVGRPGASGACYAIAAGGGCVPASTTSQTDCNRANGLFTSETDCKAYLSCSKGCESNETNCKSQCNQLSNFTERNYCLQSCSPTKCVANNCSGIGITNSGPAGSVTSGCAVCVVSKRGDLVKSDGLYATNGWDVSQGNWRSIVNNWCSVAGVADCKSFLQSYCTNECKGVTFTGGASGSGGTSGGGNSGGSGSGGPFEGASSGGPSLGSASSGCNATNPSVWACYQNGINGVGKGNCAYCLANATGSLTSASTNTACYNDCYAKTGNGSGCKYVCDNNASCWEGCKAQGKSCLGTCLGGSGQSHLECITTGGGGQSVKLNDNDAKIKYSGPWGYTSGGGGSSVAYKQDYHFAPAPLSGTTITKNLGASASLTFTGSKVTFGALGWVNRGNIDVYIDGVKVDSVKGYTGQVQQVTWTSSTLSCGEHTIKLTQSDTAGNNGGRGVALDYIEYAGCGGETGYACTKVAGAGGSKDGCTAEGSKCTPGGGGSGTGPQVSACWGNSGKDGKCYDCNGDGEINILDFSCFAKHWLEKIL